VEVDIGACTNSLVSLLSAPPLHPCRSLFSAASFRKGELRIMNEDSFCGSKAARARDAALRRPLPLLGCVAVVVFLVLVVFSVGLYAPQFQPKWSPVPDGVRVQLYSTRDGAAPNLLSPLATAAGADAGAARSSPHKGREYTPSLLSLLTKPADTPDLTGLQLALQERLKNNMQLELEGAVDLPPPPLGAFRSMGQRLAGDSPDVAPPQRERRLREPKPPKPVDVEARVGRVAHRVDQNSIPL
jgi:hypothetical protein